ncbi:methylated-DNA--[protein]-cysteine S-methyltransferase [Bacillus sp. FJAT-29790]|uniref:methylated-DNA--[protein]-cysteine S-methyltransferase n=1 Tax=Bacillus sp. FJAT-29790 TaxID=1895002 RepID=UPI001C239EDB|nr:methylated-DNA--[protein]-cysteine S-methyltransferase [Bacillus sp. FJAT-29790]
MAKRKYSICETPLGDIYMVVNDDILAAVYIGKDDFLKMEKVDELIPDKEDHLLKEGVKQIIEYFNGTRRQFNLPIEPRGTSFQEAVWKELCDIPFGETRSYQDIASQIGNPKAVRAIGQANKANNLPLVIPCHRVIGKNQSLTGYAGTRTDIKEKLLNLEGAVYKPSVGKGSL